MLSIGKIMIPGVIPRAIQTATLLLAALFATSLGALEIELQEGTHFAVSVSPDGKQLVFDLQGTLWLMAAEGGKARALTDPRDDSRLPKWSPDGSRIAYQAYRENFWQIWMISPDNGAMQQITTGPFDHREPTWSADGQRLYFATDRSGNYDIWAVDVPAPGSTSTPVQVTDTEGDEFSPAVSADNQLAYLVKEPGWGAPTVIRTVDGDSAVDAFVQKGSMLSGLSWQSDGQALTVVRYDDVWNARETSLIRIVPGDPVEALLSPEQSDVFPFPASWLNADVYFYTRNGSIQKADRLTMRETVIPFSCNIEVQRPDRKTRKVALDDPSPRPLKGVYGPVVSPDGKQIAFSALGDLWLMSVKENGETEAPRQLKIPGSHEIQPAFSPDANKLAYASDRSGSMDIWLYDLITESHSPVTTLTGNEANPAWSPDGKLLSYARSEDQGLQGERILAIKDLLTGSDRDIARRGFSPGKQSWSADGRYLIYSELQPASSLFREGKNILKKVEIATGAIESLAWSKLPELGSRMSSGPDWSADGSKVVFVSGGHLWLARPDIGLELLGSPERLSEDLASSPSITADGRWVLYQSGAQLKRLNLEKGTVQTLPVSVTWNPPAEEPDLLIQAGRVFDTTTGKYLDDLDILIREGRISTLAPRGEISFQGRVLDARDRVVMPGLIESHAHPSVLFGQALGRLWLSFGITSVREPGTDPHEAILRKETWGSGAEPGPRLFYAGPLTDGSRIYYSMANPVATDAMLLQELQAAVDLGYDMIKTYVRLPDRKQEQVINFAHRNGMLVSSHYLYPAAAFGVDATEHMGGTSRFGFSNKQSLRNVAYQDVISILTQTGITLSPTLSLQVGLAALDRHQPELLDDYRYQAFYSEAERTDFKKRFVQGYFGGMSDAELDAALERHRKELRQIVTGGGRITAGSDAPIVPYGLSLLTELLSMSGAEGLTHAEALMSATSWAADAMGVGDQLGRIEPGMLADIIIVNGDPLSRIQDIFNIEQVISAGRVFGVQELTRNK